MGLAFKVPATNVKLLDKTSVNETAVPSVVPEFESETVY